MTRDDWFDQPHYKRKKAGSRFARVLEGLAAYRTVYDGGLTDEARSTLREIVWRVGQLDTQYAQLVLVNDELFRLTAPST